MQASPGTVRAICEGALQIIGAYSVHDAGADAGELARSAQWLDDMLRHTAGTHRNLWRLSTATIDLEAETTSYSLVSAFGATAPADGMVFPVSAFVRDTSGNDTPVEIVFREVYDDIRDKDETGTPARIHIDRLAPTATLYVHPIPVADDTYTLHLTIQSFSPNPTGKAVENRTTGLRLEWDMWAKHALALVIGGGPVRRLREEELTKLKDMTGDYWHDLMAYANRERNNAPPQTEPWGL